MTDPEIASPYTEEEEQAIRARALARARADKPGRQTPTGPEITAAMLARLDTTRAARDLNRARLNSWDERQAKRTARINEDHALIPLIRDFEDYLGAQLGDEPDVVEWAVACAEGSRDWLVILGPTGTGKTHQAVAAYRAVVHDTGCEAIAARLPALLMRTMPSAPDPANLRPLEEADLLLLDDLGGDLTPWDRRVLFRLIDGRSARNRPTIITSNLRPEEIRERLGDRLASRLSQRVRVVILTGPDRRTTPVAPNGGDMLPL
jgi:DNA replication protein DnaC